MKKPLKAHTDKDKNVFKSPQTKESIKGYTITNRFFVDNSGFGTESESALTPNQFLNNVRAGFYYGITSVGQFQVYITEFKKD